MTELALCAWCGHAESYHGPHYGGPDQPGCAQYECVHGGREVWVHAFETTASALARLKRYEEALREIVSGAPWTGKPPYKWMQDRARAALADG